MKATIPKMFLHLPVKANKKFYQPIPNMFWHFLGNSFSFPFYCVCPNSIKPGHHHFTVIYFLVIA